MLEITVKTLDSQNHSFTVLDETTVRQLKESIFEKMEVPVEIQRLIYHGKVLQDEKKLTDYGDVHGKVIHLVQRPPPTPSRTSSTNNLSENNQRSNNRRSHFNNRERLDGSSSTYLGAMAFPPDLMEAQGMIQLPPSQRLSRRRLLVAQRMLNQAGSCISALENNENQNPGVSGSQEVPRPSSRATSEASGSGREEAEVFLGETTGSIARAAQAATAAAIAAAVSAAHTVVVPHITIRGASGQNDTRIPNLDNSNSNVRDINLNLNIDDNHPEDVAVEVEIGGNSDAGVDECHEGDSIANNLDNNPWSNNVAPPRLSVERTSSFAVLIEQLEEQQRRFQGLLRNCHQLMVDDPSLTENSSPNAEECQRLFNGVSEIMHYFAHAYHALSDIMVDFNEDTPRTLRCRPVIIQHSAILETVFPIQAQINLSTRRSANESGSNPTAGESEQPVSNATVNPSNSQAQTNASAPENLINSQNIPEVSQESREENITPHESASSFTSTATQQSDERSQSSQSGGTNNTSGFFLSGPGNLEVFMDFRPESVTLGSVETTLILDNEARSRNSTGTGIQLRNLGAGRSPIELLQSVQAVANQIQNRLVGRVNQQPPHDQPPPYEDNLQQTSSENLMSNQSVSSNAHTSSSAESTSAQPNATNARPHVHVGRAIPVLSDAALNSYDPFLPCNSHHIRPQNRSQNRNGNSPGTTTRSGNESDRPQNSERDSFITMMSQLLNPQRVSVNRGQARQPPSGSGNQAPQASQSSSSRNPRQNPGGQLDPGINEAHANVGWTAMPSNVTAWSVPVPPSTSPSSRRNFLDNFRISSRDFPGERNLPPRNLMDEPLSTIFDSSYVEGESIVHDFFLTLNRNLTWPDVIEISAARRTMESIVNRLHPALHTFVVQRLLQGEAPSEENIARACERLYNDLKPYVDVMQVARLRESVDLAATINNFNHSQIPELVGLIVDPSLNQSPNFGQAMTRRVRNYFRQLIAIIIHCCQDGAQGFDAIVQDYVRMLTPGVPEELRQWMEINSINRLRNYTTTLDVPLEDIQRYLVYRIPAPAEKNDTPSDVPEPMETETLQARSAWVQPETMMSPEKAEEPIAEALVDLDTDNLPHVLIGSETWHNALPSEWVPIIARDTQRQRRQSSQKPFSDAYLSSLPPKRRKIIASAKPQGSLSQVISEGVRQAISAAGVNSTVAERAIAEAGKDDVLQEAYKEQERLVVSSDLKRDPDFTPHRFPNAFKYFDK